LLAAIAFGSAMDATIKYLCQSNNVALVTTARYLFGAAFSLIPWLHAGRPTITREIFLAHVPRGLVVAACGVTFFWGLTVLPLAEAVTITFIYPLLAPFIAKLMIGEHVRPASVIAALIGFAGVIVAMVGAPSVSTSPLHAYGVAAVMFSTIMFSIAMVMLRDRARKDGADHCRLALKLDAGTVHRCAIHSALGAAALGTMVGFSAAGRFCSHFYVSAFARLCACGGPTTRPSALH
jgi:S-adenosylmethionine uptake transporter